MNRRTTLVLAAAGLVLGSSAALDATVRPAAGAPQPHAGRTIVAQYRNHGGRPWLNPHQSPQRRARELLAAMSLAQKVHMLHGVAVSQSPVPTDGYIPGMPRLGVPP